MNRSNYIVEEYVENSENNISLSVSQEEHFEEKEAISNIKMMIGIGELQIDENDIKDIEINSMQKVISKHESVVNKVFIEDIDIYFKSEIELQPSSNDIQKDILITFLRNRDANEKKKGCSSVARFLIENNLNQEETKKNEINKNDENNKLKLNKLNTFISNKSEGIEFNPYWNPKNNKKTRLTFCKNLNELENNRTWTKCSLRLWVQGSIWGYSTIISEKGKLIVMFASVLISMNHIIDATKVIEIHGLKYEEDKFCLANTNKLFGLLFLIEESRSESIRYFDKSLKLFKELKSLQGEAIIYYLKSIALRIHDYEDDYNNIDSLKESKRFAERAMIYFKYLKHYEGFMKCSKLCEKSENPPNKHTKLNILGDPNFIPYIEREHKYEFFSLGLEPILTTQFESDIDFEEVKNSINKINYGINKQVCLKKLKGMITNIHNLPDSHLYEEVKQIKTKPMISKTNKIVDAEFSIDANFIKSLKMSKEKSHKI